MGLFFPVFLNHPSYFHTGMLKKVVVHEVQRENIDIIKNNKRPNNVNGETHNLAISERDKVISISLTKIISIQSIDIAKFNCKGFE